jgi:hypothetical protein
VSTITTAAELDALPVGSVVRSSAGTIGYRYDETRGIVFGDDRCFPWGVLELPLTVIYRPDQPQRSEAAIKAEALRDAAVLFEADFCGVTLTLRALADQIEAQS